MRTEQEMFDLILNIAKADERIRAVYMNGSRVNSKVKKDIYQDYDIVYVVTEIESFLNDENWISVFGEIAIVQEPDYNDLAWKPESDFTKSYSWLMLFKDYNRIDLRIIVKDRLNDYLSDTLTIQLLDKDNIMQDMPIASDEGYWVKPPTKEKYHSCCNEFWWCLNNIAKGIVREQLPYAMRMYTEVVHIELEKMTEWYIGVNNQFIVTTGMWGKYFKKYLQEEQYCMYLKTYSSGDYEELWAAIFTACKLFRAFAIEVGTYFDYDYIESEDKNMMRYLLAVKNGII